MRVCAGSVLLLTLLSIGCGPTVDLTKGLEVTIVETGWFDAGIINGQNKLVPRASFILKNKSDQTLGNLQVNASFRRVGETEEWGNDYVKAPASGLAPGASTPPLTATSQRGYTGSEQSRQEMLQNSHFVDATIELSAKYGSVQWVRVGSYPIKRQLLTK